jgi:hypothetical protein
VTRPRSEAAKSGADVAFIELALSEDAHPPVANISVATATSKVFDLVAIAPQVRRPI